MSSRPCAMAYAELQITSNFSFLRSGSHPEEVVLRAAELGLSALALTDRNTLAGVVRAHCAAKEVGIRFVVGARLDLEPGSGPNAGSVVPLSSAGFAQVVPFPNSGLTRESPVNALSTDDRQDCAACDTGNPCAIPKRNGGMDSHHSLRHAPILPSSGKQIVKASGSMPPLEQRGASRACSTCVEPAPARSPSRPPNTIVPCGWPGGGAGWSREIKKRAGVGKGKIGKAGGKNGKNRDAKGRSLLVFPTDRAAYGRLSQLISTGQRRAEKGQCRLWLEDLLAHGEGQIVVALPPDQPDAAFPDFLRRLRHELSGPVYLAAQHLYRGDDAARIEALAKLAATCGTPLVATGDVLYHAPERRPLQDVVSCIREHTTIDQAGFRLEANAERHLKPAAEIARLFRGYPDALERTLEITDACRFALDELAYEYPIDPVPEGLTVQEHLANLTLQGARERYPDGLPPKVEKLIAHELELIFELNYAPYFLTVHDIVRFAKRKGILCQGRGSAANSAVCYCLGITAVDPDRFDLLFERFVSAERNEPPDIDVDFERERREEVIQYVYAKYGRAHAGIAATVIHYRSRSAIREVGKALGLSEDAVSALASGIWGWSEGGLDERLARERGLDPTAPRLKLALELARQLIGFPRHLSQHVGGFVLTRSRLDQVVPVVNAAMDERTFVEWDKDDLDALGILKIDVLALGMLTCIRKAFGLLERHHGRKLDLAYVPPEDPAVYEMLGRADSLGVFQVESRAQMTMLPRLRPRCFYDLIIESRSCGRDRSRATWSIPTCAGATARSP